MSLDIVIGLAAVPAVFAILIYVLGHLLSTLLNKPDIKSYVEAELMNILFIFVALSMIPAMDVLTTQFTYYVNPEAYNQLCQPYPNIINNGRCHIVVAGFHLEMMGRELVEYYSNIFLVKTFIAIPEGFGKTDVVQGGKGVDTSLFSMFTAPINFFLDRIDEVMSLLTVIEFSQLNLVWIMTDPIFFQGILLLGILMRLTPPLKLFGGLLIATALGLYYIYPLSLVLIDAHYRTAYDEIPGMGRINRLDFVHRIADITTGWVAGSDYIRKGSEKLENNISDLAKKWQRDPYKLSHVKAYLDILSSTLRAIKRLIALLFQIAWVYVTLFYGSILRLMWLVISGAGGSVGGAYTSTPNDFIPAMFNMISEFMLIIAVGTYVSLISTIAFIKTTSPLLGGDVEIAGITKLI